MNTHRMNRRSASNVRHAEQVEVIEMGNGIDRIYWVVRLRGKGLVAYVSGPHGMMTYERAELARQAVRRINTTAPIRTIGILEDAADPRNPPPVPHP